MPTYEYECVNDGCDKKEQIMDVIKSFTLLEREEKCGSCDAVMQRKFGVTTHISTGQYTHKVIPKVKHAVVTNEVNIDYEYACKNEKCAQHDKPVIIRKTMNLSEREEKCEFCSGVLNRVYSIGGGMWGEDTTRPSSDSRKDEMIKAVDRGDMDTVARLNKT